jgi:hypothetical protein
VNTKKYLITTVAATLVTAVMHAQQAPEDLRAEQRQLAQLKAELEAREKALARREKILAEKEKAIADSAPRSSERGKAKAKHQQAIAQSQEEQAKAARAEKNYTNRLPNAWVKRFWNS